MSIVRMVVRCEKCHKKYMFNPDVGRNSICPHCLGTGKKLKKANRRKKDDRKL